MTTDAQSVRGAVDDEGVHNADAEGVSAAAEGTGAGDAGAKSPGADGAGTDGGDAGGAHVEGTRDDSMRETADGSVRSDRMDAYAELVHALQHELQLQVDPQVWNKPWRLSRLRQFRNISLCWRRWNSLFPRSERRQDEEEAKWRLKDPINRFKQWVVVKGWFDEAEHDAYFTSR